MSNTQDELASNVEIAPSGIVGKKNLSKTQDELASHVDIAPSGIVAKANDVFHMDMINSDSDVAGPVLQDSSDTYVDNRGT